MDLEAPIVALAGGVGGAKLAEGLAGTVAPERLRVIVNTADDFRLWGLHISPDLDTVMYTLAGIANPETGWGIAGDTFEALAMLDRLGEDPWFRIGDRDLATHVRRTAALGCGRSLTDITAAMSSALGIGPSILPMSDSPVATIIETPRGTMSFQEYFVARGQQDDVWSVAFDGIDSATLTDEAGTAIDDAGVIVFCPSNPIVSIGPILALPGARQRLAGSPAVRVAVSPIVAGRAIKGPADRMLTTLGHQPSATGVAALYQDLVDIFVIDTQDAHETVGIEALGMQVVTTDTIMGGYADRERLAREVLDTAGIRRGARS